MILDTRTHMEQEKHKPSNFQGNSGNEILIKLRIIYTIKYYGLQSNGISL